ncbi:MAG: HlyD family efflux transporter periplasmic adaptor subunit [Elainellaceae cyanobacterium]
MNDSPKSRTTHGQNGQPQNGQMPPAGNGNPSQQSIAVAANQPSPSTQDQSSVQSSNGNRKLVRHEPFDQPVILQQPSFWSRGIIWGIIGVTTFGVLWACLAKIEEAVSATGKLEPQGTVYEVEPPVGGVVDDVLVRDGDRVDRGDLLVRLDPEAAQAEQAKLQEIQDSLTKENQYYRAQLSGVLLPDGASPADLDLPAEIIQLTASRRALLEENKLYATLLAGGSESSLSANQQIRLRAIQAEAGTRTSAAQLQVRELQEELSQVQSQIATARQTLAIEQSILDNIGPLVEEGAIAELQYRRQEVETLNRQAELDRLAQQQDVLQVSIARAREQLLNTVALTQTDMLGRIAENEKQIAEIDSQINKSIVENEKQLADINSQLRQTELTLDYQEIRAPIDGVVFDLQAQIQGYVNTNISEPILKIVPSDALVARVFITNQDIGFIDEGMPVDVRIDSFPFSEFGDVKGEVTWIGSDALPPDEIRPFYTFPTKIQLDQQSLVINGKEVNLQSGMSISANIKTRERRVITIFTDLFVRKLESLKNTR